MQQIHVSSRPSPIIARLLVGVSCLGLAAGWSSLAQAQSAEPAQLEEVVVTAQHRSETLQKTPIAITAVAGDEIRARQLNSIGDALTQTPAVVIQNSTKGQAVFIRGIGSTGDAQEGGDPAINLNIDGVYQQQAVVALANTVDINRIEVLRGPQGTLYGRNSNAGSVNILTNDPSLDGVDGFASVQLGNYSAVRTEAAVSLPLAETAGLRLAMATNKHDGYYSNGGAAADSYAGRAKLLLKPSDALSIRITGLYAREEGAPNATVPAPANKDNPYNTYYSQFGLGLPRGVRDVKLGQVYGQMDYEAAGLGVLTLLASYNYVHQVQDTALLPFGASTQDVTEKAKSFEARLASLPDSPVKWVAGLYHYRADDTPVLDPAILINFPHNARSVFPVNVASGYGARSTAAFGQVTVPISERLRLTGGLRYTRDNKTTEFKTETALLVYVPGPRYENTYTSTTYKVGAEYDVSERSMAYAQVSTGYKAGGFNGDGTFYEPEKILAYEAGLKNRFWDNRVQLNLSAFYYDYDGYQERLNGPDATSSTGFSQKIVNAAVLKTYGGEADLTIVATPQDRFHFTTAYLHSRGDVSYIGGTYTNPVAYNFSNVTPPNSPTWSGTVGYAHTFNLSSGATIIARGDLRYSSKYDTSVDDSVFDGQKAFTRTDVSVTYTNPTDRWSARLFLRNVENDVQTLFTLAPPVPGLAALQLSDPQTYGLILSAKF